MTITPAVIPEPSPLVLLSAVATAAALIGGGRVSDASRPHECDARRFCQKGEALAGPIRTMRKVTKLGRSLALPGTVRTRESRCPGFLADDFYDTP